MINQLKTGLILPLCLILLACTNIQTQPDLSDTNSTEATVETDIERVVALSSLTADLTQQLSASKLVGVPGSNLLKKDPRFAQLPIVSKGRTPPDLETIVALKPDLVLGASGFHDKIAQRLEEIGISTLLVDVDSWSALTKTTEEIASRLAANSQPLLQRYQSCLDKAPSQGRSILVLVSRQPILSPNRNSWTGDFLQQFNAENLTADLQGESPVGGYVTLSAEKVLQENPDTIIIVDPGNKGILSQFQKDGFWGKLQASTKERIYTLDYYGFVNPGSIEKIEEACDRLSQILMN